MKNELAFKKLTQALDVMSVLIDNDYVCMLSREEDLYIVNYEWSNLCDRNGVVFMTQEAYEEEWDKSMSEAREFWGE